MSEYNKFLKYFNKEKNGTEDLSEKEDIIPIKDKTENADSEEKISAEGNEDEISLPDNKDTESDILPDGENDKPDSDSDGETQEAFPEKQENDDTVPTGRFIKNSDSQYIAVNSKNRNECPTAAEKYTDRLLPTIPEKKPVEEQLRKKSSYEQNHAPSSASGNFIKTNAEETDENGQSNDTEQAPESTTEQINTTTSFTEDDNSIDSSDDSSEKTSSGSSSGDTKHISNKGDLLRKIAKTSDGASRKDENQMTMEGFREEEEDIPVINTEEEEQLRRELMKVREKRIKNFKFWTRATEQTGESEDTSFSAEREEKQLPGFLNKIREKFAHLDTDFLPMGDDEFSDPSRRKEIFSALLNAKKNALIKAAAVALLGVILVIINTVTSVSAAMNNGFFTVLGGSAAVYSALNLVFLLICGIIMLDDLKKGLFSFLKIRPKTDSALLFMYIGALAQTVASFFSELKPESEYHLLSGAVIFLCAPVLISKAFYYDSTRHCFKAAGATNDKCYLRKISDRETVASILKDRDNSAANVVYTGKTRFISGFLKRSASSAFAGQVSSRVIIAAAAAAVIAGIIGLVTTKSPVYALGCLSATAAIAFPVSCLVFTGFALSSENSVLSVKSSYIGSYSDTYSFGCIDNILLDGEDIFSAEVIASSCGKNISSKQAEFCAAVLTSKSGGMLAKAFSALSQGLEEHYPEVESLTVEEKMGLSAWISDCKVLLGTQQFLENHNVTLPEDHSIPFISNENTRPLFLAIEGHFAAVFSVRYSCDKTAAKSLSELANKGANILLSISDPNITEQFGEELMNLPENSLRLTGNKFNAKFEIQRNTITNSEDTGIVFTDSFSSFARTMAGAIKLEKLRRTAKYLCEAASIAGLLLGIFASATRAQMLINGWPVILLHICWLLLSFVLTPALCSTSLKKKFSLPENITARQKTDSENGDKTIKSISDLFADDTEDTEEEDEESKQETDSDEAEAHKNENTSDNTFTAVAPETDSVRHEAQSEPLRTEAIYDTAPLRTIDFSTITGDELPDAADDADNSTQTVSDDILDLFADSSERKASSSDRKKTQKKQGFFSRIGFGIDSDDEEEEKNTKKDKKAGNAESAKRSIFSFGEDNIPAPPRYDLNKNKADESDPLNATFVPPGNDAPSALYNDSFFASFDTKEDDKAFEDVRRRRQEEEDEGSEFDFWTKK